MNAIIGGLADVPVHSWNKGSRAIEEILAIVEEQNGKSPLRLIM